MIHRIIKFLHTQKIQIKLIPCNFIILSLASFLKICHQSDPYLSDCIKQSVNSLKPYLRKGIPALGIPKCEPLHLDEIEIDQSSGPIYIRAIYNNVSIFGGTDFVPKSIR